MKTIVIIPCHNQQELVNLCINLLKQQSVKPDQVLVVNDHSFLSLRKKTKETELVRVIDSPHKGRVFTRNHGIEYALRNEYDTIIFLDGDCIPQDHNFIRNYLKRIKNPATAVFGMRRHIPRPRFLEDFNDGMDYEEIQIKKYPSDLLTANLDKKRRFNNEDLRIVSGAFEAFNKAKTQNAKLSLLTTGMIAWSCNFCVTREALQQLNVFRKEYFKADDYFDTVAFGDVWGGEDNVFGMDLLAAGVDIKLTNKSNIYHFMHNRSDELFSHIKINEIMLNRYYEIRKIHQDCLV